MVKRTTKYKKNRGNKSLGKKLPRKALRKQKQQQIKENKRLFFSKKNSNEEPVPLSNTVSKIETKAKKKQSKQKFVKSTIDPEKISVEKLLSGNVDPNEDESIDSDFTDEDLDVRMPNSKQMRQTVVKKKQHIPSRPDVDEEHKRDMRRKKELENASRKHRMKYLVEENEDEDKMIARLEKKLRLNKSKDKNRTVRKMFDDGLDYALEVCLDDEKEKQRELKQQKKQQGNIHDASSSEDDDIDGEDDFTDNGSEESESSTDNDDSDNNDDSSDKHSDDPSQEYKEDIYGRKRDKDGNVIQHDSLTASLSENNDTQAAQKYIPPHQRSLISNRSDSQALERLYKNCKGLLNRLSEANLHKIAAGIEELYMKNSRFNMNETLTKLINEALIGRTLINERMAQEHIVVVAYLHAHIGNEIGAHFLQVFIKRFVEFLTNISSIPIEDKHLNNLILVLSYLYIFKIYEHRLFHQIIDKLADNLCEKSIECLLLIFQSVGFKLRKDDPLQFKQMMHNVQKKIAESPLELKENLRLKFMVDILNAVKNNNINKIPHFDPELAETLRKRLKAMLRNDKYVVTLNITMDDLLRADQVGKWWIVGSAWSGNIEDISAAKKSDAKSDDAPTRYSESILKLAKKLKMNTDERRNVFCIVMSAEDFVDAFEKIMHLSLKDQRTLAYVIIHCCLHEKQSNPYYSHLALKFCNYNRSFQLAFQYASWDRINDIKSLNKQQIVNLANFLQYLILNGGLGVAVLKVVDFLQLSKLNYLLMRKILVGLLLTKTAKETQIYQIFESVAKNTKLNQFKNSIRLFMKHFLLNDDCMKFKLYDEDLLLLKKRITHIDNMLAYVDL